MADISSLCERVIVIDHGKKIYDGALARITGAGARQRIIKFKPRSDTFPADWKPSHGIAKVCEDGEILLHVPSEHVTAVFQQILSLGAVDDITIQDVPLEDVITELFSRGMAAK
jgi:ABC-2 type transport system ATP-binding protein